MFKRTGTLLIVILMFVSSCGCGTRDNSITGSTTGTAGGQARGQEGGLDPQGSRSPEKETDIIKEQISKMSLDEKIGQMVMVGVDDYINNSHSKEMIDQYHVGGFILFKRNIKDAVQALDLINSLKAANEKNSFPLFIGVDEEGGSVSRMPGEFVKIPTSKAIGKVNKGSFSFEIGRVIAQEIKALGINMDFAPVLDINSNPGNPVIGDRALGADPETVSTLGIQTMKGIQSQGVISAVKHFPGHGDTSTDSHVGLPVVYNDIDRLKSFELVPFSEAVKNNADAVMVAHILLPQIDDENPASLSKAIITGILRTDLKFGGVVITDDMTMGAIAEKYDMGEAAVKSVNAGSDIILVCHDYDKELTVIKALKRAAETGAIQEGTIDGSVYRILKLKQKYGLTNEKINSIDVNHINSSINGILNKYLNGGVLQ